MKKKMGCTISTSEIDKLDQNHDFLHKFLYFVLKWSYQLHFSNFIILEIKNAQIMNVAQEIEQSDQKTFDYTITKLISI